MGKTILEMIDIKKSFSGIYALSGINFSLEMGEVHALLGENGAGKSTLIKVLGGIYKPDSGKIRINGQDVEINGVSDAQEKGIGIIHQEIVLVPYLTEYFPGKRNKDKVWHCGYERNKPQSWRDAGESGCEYSAGYTGRDIDHCPAADGGNCKSSFL